MLIQDKVMLKQEKNVVPKLDFTNLHHNNIIYMNQAKKQPSPFEQKEKVVFQPRKKSTNVKRKAAPNLNTK